MARTSSPPLERQVLEALPFEVYTTDLEGRLTFVSGARAAGARAASPLCDDRAVIGASLWDAMPDVATREQVRDAMSALREGRATSLAWELPCSPSTEDDAVLVHVAPIAQRGAVSGYVVATVDVTPSVRSREALLETGIALAGQITVERVAQELAQQLRRLLTRESLTCDALAIAVADDEHAALQLVHHVGFAADAAALRARLCPAWDEALATGDLVTAAADGVTEITAPMLGEEGSIGALTVAIERVVTPHGLDDARRALAIIAAEGAAAIERAWTVSRAAHRRRLEAISEMSAGIAHELRNPLFGISSAAQLLRFRVKEDPVVEKNVGRILREVERLNGLVTALLEYGRPGTPALAPADPDAVWDDVLEAQRGRLESRALLLERHRAAPPARCHLDAQQIAQVFTHLLANAVDAAPEGSDLTLDSETLPNGAWRCRLHNGGAPIAPDVLPRVFEMFFSTRPGSPGLGLPLCQRIVEDHGGSIAVTSEPGAGTIATVVLPPD